MPLRFGLSALEFQEVTGRVIIDGIPDFSRLNVVDIVREAVSSGYSVIELGMEVLHVIPGSLTSESIDRLVDLKEELGHSYTVHLPLWSVELATFNEPVRLGGVTSTIEAIELAKPLEPETYVLHATGALAAEFSGLNYDAGLVRLISTLLAGFAAASVEDIISKTEIEPHRLAIENTEFPFDVIRDLIDDQDTGICFDTAHLLCRMSGNESVMDFYSTHKDRITEVHLQDATYKKYEDAVARSDHIALGRGVMGNKTLREFLLELSRDRFEGPIIFELSKSEAGESLTHIEEVVPEALD